MLGVLPEIAKDKKSPEDRKPAREDSGMPPPISARETCVGSGPRAYEAFFDSSKFSLFLPESCPKYSPWKIQMSRRKRIPLIRSDAMTLAYTRHQQSTQFSFQDEQI